MTASIDFSSRDQLSSKPVMVDRPRLLGLVIADKRVPGGSMPAGAATALGFPLSG
jgi:hypothetical protein